MNASLSAVYRFGANSSVTRKHAETDSNGVAVSDSRFLSVCMFRIHPCDDVIFIYFCIFKDDDDERSSQNINGGVFVCISI